MEKRSPKTKHNVPEKRLFDRIFGGINLTWGRLIIFAVATGIFTALMALLPIAKDTSFADIAISFEVWILFGIFIIMNSKSATDSALKCFAFFLISQPLVYLIQVPFSDAGFGLFRYYGYWFLWTLATPVMGFVGYFLKKDRWWGILILLPVLILLGFCFESYLQTLIFDFPHHLLSTVFCFLSIMIYSMHIFKNPKIKAASMTIGGLVVLVMTVSALQIG